MPSFNLIKKEQQMSSENCLTLLWLWINIKVTENESGMNEQVKVDEKFISCQSAIMQILTQNSYIYIL